MALAPAGLSSGGRLEIDPASPFHYSARTAIRNPGRVSSNYPLAADPGFTNGPTSSPFLGRMVVVLHDAAFPFTHFYFSLVPVALVVFIREPKLARSSYPVSRVFVNPGNIFCLWCYRLWQNQCASLGTRLDLCGRGARILATSLVVSPITARCSSADGLVTEFWSRATASHHFAGLSVLSPRHRCLADSVQNAPDSAPGDCHVHPLRVRPLCPLGLG